MYRTLATWATPDHRTTSPSETGRSLSSRHPGALKRLSQSPCQCGLRIIMADGTHRVAPVEGQGRLRHQNTHASHTCSFYTSLDTWICLACGFYGIDIFKSLARPCSKTPLIRRVGTICPVSDVASCQAPVEQPVTSTRDKRAVGTSAGVSERQATEKVANEHIPPCAGMIVCGTPTARLPVCAPAAHENAGASHFWVRWTGNQARRPNDRATTASESLAFRKHRQRRTHQKIIIIIIIHVKRICFVVVTPGTFVSFHSLCCAVFSSLVCASAAVGTVEAHPRSPAWHRRLKKRRQTARLRLRQCCATPADHRRSRSITDPVSLEQ